MTEHNKIVVWAESEDRSGAATGLGAVPDNDQAVTVSGDNLKLPPGYPFVRAIWGWTAKAAYPLQYYEISQSSIANHPWRLRGGINGDDVGTSWGNVWDLRGKEPVLKSGEDTTVTAVEDDEAGVAHVIAVAMILSAQRKNPYAVSPFPITHLSHSTGAQVAASDDDAWQTSVLTQTNSLDEGVYAILGAKVISATAYAARLIIAGYDERPAIIPVNDEDIVDHPMNHNWDGSFRFRLPDYFPRLQIVADAQDTPAGVILELAKVG